MAQIAIQRPRGLLTPEPDADNPGSRLFKSQDVFAPDSFWSDNQLADDAPLHASSATWAANLALQLGLSTTLHADGTRLLPTSPPVPGKAWFSVSHGGVPVVVVPANQPRVPVANGYVLRGTAWSEMFDLHEVFMAGVPVPPGAPPDASGDKTLVVYQPSTGGYWELYIASEESGTDPQGRSYDWVAYGGGHIAKTWGRNGEYRNDPPHERYAWGHTATGLPIAGGIITPEEWMSWDTDVIRHVLHLTVGWASRWFLPPAHRTDGFDADTFIREGARVRFPADWDWSYLDSEVWFSMQVMKLGKAMQRYGALITDKTGGGVAFRFRNTNTYVWEGVDTGLTWNNPDTGQIHWPNDFMWRLPWQTAQILEP